MASDARGECVDGGDGVVCRACMDMYRDPVYLECGHTVCRCCALTTLVAAARLAALPTVSVFSTKATTKPHAHGGGGGCGGAVGAMPGKTNAPQSTSASSASSSGCQWGCCSPDATVEIKCPFRCTRTTRTAISGDNLKPNTVAMSLVEKTKAELTKSTLCEAQYCCEEPTSSPSPATCKSHNLGVQCNSLEALVKNHRALISKANEVARQQQPLEVLQARSILSSFLLDKRLLLDTHRLEPCEQAKAVMCRSGSRDEVIGMIRGFGTVAKGMVPNTPSEGRAPRCSRSSGTDGAITVQWDQPPPLLNETSLEQVVGYNVIVSPSNSTDSASSSTEGRTVIEVKGRETTKCNVTVDSNNEVSVGVCAVSLVGSSEPTQRATVPPLPPTPTREVEVFAWGAAGGANNSHNMAGGPGGFSTARMLVKPGTQLTIVVGQGGAGLVYNPNGTTPTRRSFGGGGSGGSGGGVSFKYSGGGGGGCSAVMVGGVPLVVAGGGGGSAIYHSTQGYGGGGGGETGSADGDQRKRATQEAPGGWGDNSPQCGDKFRGGDGLNAHTGASECGGGGGGGGLFGGAGGHTYNGGGKGGSGGGGGSGFVVAPTTTTSSSVSGGVVGAGGCVVSVISSRTVCGQRATACNTATTPPETNNEHYRDGAGGCVAPTNHDHPFDGNNGLVVVVVKGVTGSGTKPTTHVFKLTGQNQSLTIN
ncbi:hypothetical protein Pelo_5496 [Pelomyxa schiedti]|nr:hypothetical protein Pelo_5496 [Pelomyxa schiedti]